MLRLQLSLKVLNCAKQCYTMTPEFSTIPHLFWVCATYKFIYVLILEFNFS